MQSNSQIILLIFITTVIVFTLATITVLILLLYQKKQLVYQERLNLLKISFDRDLLKTKVEVQEQTFQSISKEIHDHINLELTLAKLNLNTLDFSNQVALKTAIASSIDLISESIEDLTHLSRSMNTDIIKNMGLIKALQNEIGRFQSITNHLVKYEINGEPIFLDCEKELVIFRIIQEAFNNILKHAKATNIFLQLNYCNDFLEIQIADNGIGFDKHDSVEKLNAGLSNMRTRAEMFGGKVNIESEPGKGTHIGATIPYF